MKFSINSDRPYSRTGFTLLELLVTLAIISILGCLLLPAMARTRIKSTGTDCLSNLRQMMVGWAMYKDENNDFLLPNAAAGGSPGWVGGTENWGTADANTNRTVYLNSLLTTYIGGHIEVYRCPGDVIPSANGQRLRSYSMNGQMSPTIGSFNPSFQSYYKGSDLTCPLPKNAFIFADESMYTLNDGFLQINLNSPDYPDCPAAYHDGACGISFADGHAEIHKWMWGGIISAGLRNVPNQFGVTGNGAHWPGSVQDVDYIWLRTHAGCKTGQSFQ